MRRIDFHNLIRDNIKRYGYHVTFVRDGQNPNFAYTVGLNEIFGFELVIAGGYVSVKLYEDLFNSVVLALNSGLSANSDEFRSIFENWERIGLRPIDKSWSKLVLLGVHDYYDDDAILAYQIYPKSNQFIDIPDMTKKWDRADLIWRWLDVKWNNSIPISAYAITNIDFLKGGTITEIMRWEEGYWEMFVGPGTNVLDKNVRILPISTFIGVDKTLQVALNLEKGEGVWRHDINSEWNIWE